MAIIIGTNTTDNLVGGAGGDALYGGAGNDMLDGGLGNDAYVFNIGDGQDIISSYDPEVGKLDTVWFGADVLPANVTAARSKTNSNDLVLSIVGTTDTLTIANYFMVIPAGSSYWDPVTGTTQTATQDMRPYAIEEVHFFADSTSWIMSQWNFADGTSGNDWLQGSNGIDVLSGLAGDDVLFGSDGNDILDGGAGNDFLNGGAGNDTYLFDIGGGQDTINNNDVTAGKLDVVQFGAGVMSTDITVTRGGWSGNDLVLSINGTTDKLTISDYFTVMPAGTTYWDSATGNVVTTTQDARLGAVDQVRFADGTIWSMAQLDAWPVSGMSLYGTSGDDMLQGSINDDLIRGLAGNDALDGNAGNDMLDGGAGNDILNGGAGNDTYLFDIGGGQDIIYNYDTTAGRVDVVQFGAGVLSTDIMVTRGGWSGNDLVLSIKGTTDTLTLANYFAVTTVYMGADPITGMPIYQDVRASAVEQVRFADGSTATRAQLDVANGPLFNVVNGTAGDDMLQGTLGNDVMNGLGGNDQLMGGAGNDQLNGGTGNDVLAGDWGNDTYLFDIGGGQDTIYDYDMTAGNVDVVQFGAGVLPGNISVTRTPYNNDLVLSINGTSDTLTIANYFTVVPAGTQYWDPATGTMLTATQDMRPNAIEEVRFADGTVWNQAQLDVINGTAGDDMLQGTLGNDVMKGLGGNDQLMGGAGNDTLDGGAGNDVLVGDMGNDTYLFDIGGGQDVIYDFDWTGTSLDVVQFGAGVQPANVTTTRGGPGGNDLVLSINGTTDTLTVANYFGVFSTYMGTDPVTGMPIYQDVRANTVEEVRFAGGTVWNTNAIAQMANHPPLAVSDSVTVSEDGVAVISQQQMLANDIDPDADTLNIIGFDAVSAQGNAVTQDPTGNFVLGIGNRYQSLGAGQTATDSFDYTIADAYGAKSTAKVMLMIAGTNDAPVVSAALLAQSVTQGQAFAYTLPSNSFTDVDAGDLLTFTATLADGSALPAWLTFNAATRGFSGTPGANSVGSLNVVVTAADIAGLSASSNFTLAVNGPVFNGTTGNDVLTGTVYDDTLNGLGGSDSMGGGAGNDTYIVDNTGDVVTEGANAGADTVRSSVTYTLGANVENLTLTGTTAINGTGNALNNVLDGSLNTAANVLTGGAGNDTYILGTGDTIVEASGAGIDTVMTAATYTLGTNLENLTLTGTAAINGTGNTLANILTGNSAANTLSGGTGADTMIGGLGNDTYVVDDTGDIVTELLNEGIDTVQSSVTYTLVANVENLTLTGTTAINGTGNALDNVLDGSVNTKANVLVGGAGNDTYVLGTGDTIVEAANAGIDTVKTGATYTLGTNLENLILTGTSAVNGTGNTLNNLLVGNAANNTLSGGAGNDILQGGLGNDTLSDIAGANLFDGGAGTDTLTGNSGNEMFIGGAGSDTINTGNGADILAFNRGDGADVVNGGIGTDNTITLGKGINYADIALSKVNNNLILEVGSGEQITLSNWYNAAANYKSVVDLQVMADALAAFNPASSDPLLNQAVQNFDFTAIVNAFDQARGANSTFMHWSATNSLLAAHLSGSDTTALGGDLAHQYGSLASLTGMNLTAAQTVINDAQFGGAPQTLHAFQGLQGGAVTL